MPSMRFETQKSNSDEEIPVHSDWQAESVQGHATGDERGKEREKIREHREAQYTYPGEYEYRGKEEEVAWANILWQKEFARLGLEKHFTETDPDRVHFVDVEEEVRHKESSLHTNGSFSFIKNDIVMRTIGDLGDDLLWDGDIQLRMFYFLLHEMGHQKSAQKFRGVAPEEVDFLDVNFGRRVGYDIHFVDEKGVATDLFEGFNEGVNDITVRDMVDRYGDGVKEYFDEGRLSYSPSYDKQVELVEYLAEEVARSQNVPVEDILDDFKRHAITGNMMHLRKIEDVFGAGALRMLAAYKGKERSDIVNSSAKSREQLESQQHQRVISFFQAKDTETRKQYAQEILVENTGQLHKYEKRRANNIRMANEARAKRRALKKRFAIITDQLKNDVTIKQKEKETLSEEVKRIRSEFAQLQKKRDRRKQNVPRRET